MNHQIIDLEQKYWQAMKDQDLETALKLTDFPCIVAGENGMQSVDKDAFVKMFNSHKDMKFKDFAIDGTPEVRELGPDTIVVAYKVKSSMEKNNEEINLNAVDTSTWVKRGGNWVCAMHTETKLIQ